MAFVQDRYQITEKTEIAPGVFDLWVACEEIAKQAQAGQFVHIRVPGFTLRRPISICEIKRDSIRLVFEVRGDGTKALAEIAQGESIDILGPLGNGFTLPKGDAKIIVVGGGIGVPPMLQPGAQFGPSATALLGFRNVQAQILVNDFRAYGCDTRIATDDGSAGHRGFVTDLLRERLSEQKADLILACGPAAMLRGVAALAEEFGVPAQVSLEEHMACGVGACLVCACKLVRDGREIHGHVCKDGPVFDAKEVVLP